MIFLSKPHETHREGGLNISKNCTKITTIYLKKLENCSDFDFEPAKDVLTGLVLGKSENM